MNRLLPFALFFVASITCGTIGYLFGTLSESIYSISLYEKLDSNSKAKLFDNSFNRDQFIAEYDASSLTKQLLKSTWTNNYIFQKGSWRILLSNGTRIHLSLYGGFFWIEGTPGYFLIPEAQKQEYSEILNDMHSMTVEWRTNRRQPNINQGAEP